MAVEVLRARVSVAIKLIEFRVSIRKAGELHV
jgi:hypothetical protein